MKNKAALHCLCQAACLLTVALMGVMLLYAVTSGASAYHSSQQALHSGYTARTLVDYASAKAQSANSAGMVYAGEFGGLPCLYITEELEGDLYMTAIYCHEGSLKELFCQMDSGLAPSDGISILDCDGFSAIQASPGLIHLSFEVAGQESFGYISVLEGGQDNE